MRNRNHFEMCDSSGIPFDGTRLRVFNSNRVVEGTVVSQMVGEDWELASEILGGFSTLSPNEPLDSTEAIQSSEDEDSMFEHDVFAALDGDDDILREAHDAVKVRSLGFSREFIVAAGFEDLLVDDESLWPKKANRKADRRKHIGAA
jgi:hypothetical protein